MFDLLFKIKMQGKTNNPCFIVLRFSPPVQIKPRENITGLRRLTLTPNPLTGPGDDTHPISEAFTGPGNATRPSSEALAGPGNSLIKYKAFYVRR